MKKSMRKRANHKPVPISVLLNERDAVSSAAHLDELLDEALEETFPASDPPSPASGESKDKLR
jgi:hypothetical protein